MQYLTTALEEPYNQLQLKRNQGELLDYEVFLVLKLSCLLVSDS